MGEFYRTRNIGKRNVTYTVVAIKLSMNGT